MGFITEIIVVVCIVCAALGYCQSVRAKENPQEVTRDTETGVKQPVPPKAHIGSAIISCILSLVIYATLRFYAEWFISSQLTTIFGGFVSSWLFLFSLTSLSNVEMLLFGDDFASKFIPEILVCLLLSVLAAGVVHRVCATTCILFSILALYFVDRISNDCYHKTAIAPEAIHHRKGGGKKNK